MILLRIRIVITLLVQAISLIVYQTNVSLSREEQPCALSVYLVVYPLTAHALDLTILQ